MFPDLCRAIGKKIAKANQRRREATHGALECALLEDPAPTLAELSRRLGYSSSSVLRANEPALCDQLANRYKEHQAKRRADLEMATAAALAETPVPPLCEIQKRLGISVWVMNQYFPGLRKQIAEMHRRSMFAESTRRRERLFSEVHKIVTDFHRRNLYPSANKVYANIPTGVCWEWKALEAAVRDARKSLGYQR